MQVEGKGQIGRCDMLLGIWSGQAFFTSFLTDNHKKALKILSCISTGCGFSCSVLFSHQHSRVIHIDSFISKINSETMKVFGFLDSLFHFLLN